MINFRYHIVSLTAVFLALVVGLLMGTTFLNQATVDQLKSQIRRAERGIDDTKATNQELRDELDRYERMDEALTANMSEIVPGKLTDVAVMVLASDGIDQDSLDRLRVAIGDAGADFRGTLVISDSLAADGGRDGELAAALEVADGTDRATLQARVQRELADALRTAAERSQGSGAEQPEIVRRLLDGGFLRFEAPDDAHDDTTVMSGGGYRYVFVSGPDPSVPDDELLLPILTDLAAGGAAPVVLASAATGGNAEEDRTLVVGPVRNDDAIEGAVSTVDDLEKVSGTLATVLALRDLGDDVRGHYGFGDGADDGILPSTS